MSSPAAARAAALEAGACRALQDAFGPGPCVTASAPGRCTLVGEHVDYVGGLVLCVAIDLHVAAAVRRAPDGVSRSAPSPLPGAAGYELAAVGALHPRGIDVPEVEVATAASLPAGAGLASSAAVIAAVTAALLRLAGDTLTPAAFVDVVHTAEHDVLGVPCGRLDQHAVVEAPAHGALLLDCRGDTASPVPWPWRDVVLVACDTGEPHRVGGGEYAGRRAEAEAALREAGVATAQDLDPSLLPGLSSRLGPVAFRRLRHVVGESARSSAAAAALRRGDAVALGALMSASHRSLRDDYEVTTPRLDATAAAAAAAGCFGARMVGAGYGGTVVALVAAPAARACAAAMAGAAGAAARTWVLHPAPGVAISQAEVIVAR